MREGEGYTLDETLLASQLLAFCEGMLSRLCAASSNIVRRMISTPAGRWSPHSCSKSHMQPPGCMILLAICVSLSQIRAIG